MTRSFTTDFRIGETRAERVLRFRESHELGVPPSLEIEVTFQIYLDIEEMVGQAAELAFAVVGEEGRVFRGIIESAEVMGSTERGLDVRVSQYALRVVPRIALLEHSFGSTIFQDKDVREIVSEVLEEHQVPADLVAWRITGTYPKREYCVQYQETPLAFISRLLEREGIYFFVEPGPDGEELVIFADDSTAAEPIAGMPDLYVRARSGLHANEDAIFGVAEQRRVRSGKYVLRDYDFKRPMLDLTSPAETDEHPELEVYDYPGGYFEPDDGARYAEVLLEAEQVGRSTLQIDASCPRITAGRKLTVNEAGSADGEYLVTRVVHLYEGAAFDSGKGPTGSYSATASLLPADKKYRSPRRTPWPVIEGPQTARVVAPSGSPMETIHTDEHGRCKVKFHWDLAEPEDDRASCWMRVGQLQTSGSMVLPRVGWEVIVEFLEGDPDRPLVTGRVYNGTFMPPYALPEGRTRTSLQTASTPAGGGANEIRLEDRAGSEEIMIRAQKDMHIVAANNKTKNVGNCESQVVTSNSTLEVGADQTVKITKGAENTVSGDQTVSVGGNRNVEVNAVAGLTVGGSATTSVAGKQLEMDGNPLEAILALAAQKAAEVAAAKAGEAIGRVEAQVQGAVNQAMGPINGVASQAQALGEGMRAVANGDLGAAPGLIGAASGLPGAGSFASSLGGGGTATRAGAGGAAEQSGSAQRAGGSPSGGPAAAPDASPGNALRAAATSAIQRGAGSAARALGSAMGTDAAGGGGASQANVGGPEGSVAGVDAEDREKGPGHSIAKVGGSYTETVSGMKIVGVLSGIATTVGGDHTTNVGAARIELALGSRAEDIGGSKNETALGLVVVARGDETEAVTGPKTTMVGGAVIEKIAGGHTIDAGGPASFIGAFHKIEAGTSITLKCGASEVVIDGSGVSITSPIVTITAAKVQLTKAVSEV